MSNCWITHLRSFLHSIKGTIILQDPWLIPKIHPNNRFLMADFIAAGYNPKELQTLNNCHLHLQVTTLAEISDHTGDRLQPSTLQHGNQTPTIAMSKSKYNWPHQPSPAKPAWNLWTKTIKTLYTKPGLPYQLKQPLGQWLPTASMTRQWQTLFHPQTNHITIAVSNTQTQNPPTIHVNMNASQLQSILPTTPTVKRTLSRINQTNTQQPAS